MSPRPHHVRRTDCQVADLVATVSVPTRAEDLPHATRVEAGVPVYDAAALRPTDALLAELAFALADGPGIVVFEGAFDPAVLAPVTAAFERIIAAEKAAGAAAGDHFAAAGANDRLWNALEKLAVDDPAAFVDYYANDALALVCRAWLGPGYQVTSQVNVVNPGGAAQLVHRDYHLGFQSPDISETYPRHVHQLSPYLTLQGAVAHTDMPVETGPTLYLPHSQKYELGYLAYWLPEFADYFAAHHVQLPLALGDAVFFNPALFHAAGANRTADVRRMANLLQVSSAFGRAMESVGRARIVRAIYPQLRRYAERGETTPYAERGEPTTYSVANVIAAAAEGYAFPTNLDRDPPLDGMSPPTMADVLARALADGAAASDLDEALARWEDARRTH
ncbi:MAG: phytanoyl-CoA dioxygenase family protein [Austwickia sp.]|nr:MAG: phytanoyl-CoA dioxygenase family protein [Austwickia sp.]